MKKIIALALAVIMLLGTCATAFAYELEYSPEEVTARGKEVALQLSEEGIVMLKNDNNTLPLKTEDEKIKINVFGTSAMDFVASGGGSGSTGSGMNFYQNLAANNFDYNTELYQAYQSWYSTHKNDTKYAGIGSIDNFALATGTNPEWNITTDMYNEKGELFSAKMDEAILDRAEEYSDIALYVISRSGTEEHDLAKQELELREPEAATLEYLTANYDKVIVILNSSNLIEMGWLEGDFTASYDGFYYGGSNFNVSWYWFGCGSAPKMGTPVVYDEPHTYTIGEVDTMLVAAGMSVSANLDSICHVLNGEVNPSGKLADTIAYDYDTNPVNENYGKYAYEDAALNPEDANFAILETDKNADPTCSQYFVTYEEGIYMGYRYYETFAPEAVQFPFGYGMSYTTFEWSDFEYAIGENEYGEDTVEIKVTVKNTGNVAGKDVVQVYYTAPFYNDSAYKVEKALVNLSEFAKTDLLEPGKSQTVSMSFDVRDMASWSEVSGCYVLENGAYTISVATDANKAHTAPADTYTLTVADGKINGTAPKADYIKADEKGGILYTADEVTGTAYENHFEDASGKLEVCANYMQRVDVDGVPTVKEGTYPVAPYAEGTDGESYSMLKRYSSFRESVEPDWTATSDLADAAPTGVVYYDEDGKVDVYTLQELYKDLETTDDPEACWDKFVQQLTVPEMIYLCGYGGFRIAELKQYGIPYSRYADGPTTLKISGNKIENVFFPTNNVRGTTWNKDLVHEMGVITGYVGYYGDYEGWYAPGANIHRSPLSGRNYEYYSEDPYLCGTFSALETEGALDRGVVVAIKHFALNDQEEQRTGISTFANEQTLREIYLNAFEIAIKDGEAHGVMTAYNRIGTRWCGANAPLLQDVLRGEWGFKGCALTDAYDAWKYQYMDPVAALLSGNEQLLSDSWSFTATSGKSYMPRVLYFRYYEQDPVGMVDALHAATKNICTSAMYTHSFDPNAVFEGTTDIGYTGTVKVGDATVSVSADNPTQTVNIPVSISSNQGLAASIFTITSPVKLTIEDENVYAVNEIETENGYTYKISYMEIENYFDNGEIFTLTAEISNEDVITNGKYTISIAYEDATDRLEYATKLNVANGTLTVANVYAKGDANCDFSVTNADLIAIARYLVDLVEFDAVQFEAADLNDDGIVNNLDLVRLARIIVAG